MVLSTSSVLLVSSVVAGTVRDSRPDVPDDDPDEAADAPDGADDDPAESTDGPDEADDGPDGAGDGVYGFAGAGDGPGFGGVSGDNGSVVWLSFVPLVTPAYDFASFFCSEQLLPVCIVAKQYRQVGICPS